MPITEVAMPMTSAGKCHAGSIGFGQAIAPRKKTLTIDVKYPKPFQPIPIGPSVKMGLVSIAGGTFNPRKLFRFPNEGVLR
jgi:hypothetical protein